MTHAVAHGLVSATALARQVCTKVLRTAESYRRQRLSIAFQPGQPETPAIYFLTPDHEPPSGGIRVIYRHVDILNAAGINAQVLHYKPGFRCTWFDNETRITNLAAVTTRPTDLIVVPEVDCDLIPRLPAGLRYAIFNQNSHLTWDKVGDRASQWYAHDPRIIALITVSAHNQRMLEHAFPGRRVRRIHLGLDPALFNPETGPRSRRLAYMPRRGAADARQVLHVLAGRGVLEGWQVVALDNLGQAAVADELRKARVYLAFTNQEGFGLPAAEAMACGAYTIGNDGFGGREFFRPEFSTRVEHGDILGFAEAIETVIGMDRRDPDWCTRHGSLASAHVLQEYSLSREYDDVVALYTELLDYPGDRRPAS